MNHEFDILTTSTRRRWVKRFMLGTVATLSGPRWLGTVLADVTSTGPGPAVIRMKVAGIILPDSQGVPVAVLAAPGGSVQYEFNGSFKHFTLNRVEINRFVTLDSVCTHFGCGVGRYKEQLVSGSPTAYMKCPCHGSRYDIEGRVFRDANGVSTEPAKRDLGRYGTTYDAATDIVSITIPNLALNINSISVQQSGPGQATRMKLVIPVTSYSTYEIMYQADFSSPLVRVPFATTPTGSANQTTVFQTSSGNFTAYVEASGPHGFFSVGLVMDEVAR